MKDGMQGTVPFVIRDTAEAFAQEELRCQKEEEEKKNIKYKQNTSTQVNLIASVPSSQCDSV